MPDAGRERKKECMKNYSYKTQNLLSDIINCVEELKNVSLSK